MRIELAVTSTGVHVTRLVPESAGRPLREQLVGGAVLAELGPALEHLGAAARRAYANAHRRPSRQSTRPPTPLRALAAGVKEPADA